MAKKENIFTKLKQSIRLMKWRKDNELSEKIVINQIPQSNNELQSDLKEFYALIEKLNLALKDDNLYVNSIESDKKLKRLINKLKSDLKTKNLDDQLKILKEDELLLFSILSEQLKADASLNDNSIIMNVKSILHSVPINSCIMPDLNEVINLRFFYSEIDRIKAEELLKDKPEGTFLLRDSSHPNYQFTVSFRRLNRSLHARIEKGKNNEFSFNINDPNSQKFESIKELFEKYKENKHTYIFSPVLTKGLSNPNPLTLKQLTKYKVLSTCNYHNLDQLPLPYSLKNYLKTFNYCNSNSV